MERKQKSKTPKTAEPAAPKRPPTFFDKPWVLVILGVLALGLAYVFASWAIDSGSLLDYSITFLLIVVGVRDLVVAARSWKR